MILIAVKRKQEGEMSDAQQTLNRLETLTDEQKVVFLKTLLFLSQQDGEVDNDEIVFIKKMAKKYRVKNVQKVFEHTTEAQLLGELKVLTSRRAALDLIKELFLLGHSNMDLRVEEILFINRVANALNISPEKVEQISRFVIDMLILQEQGKIIFEE
ncbi:MAG: hypothetical protein IKR60_03845 [Alphaproteobacteria bacterium]|nr:hypothetical protein [Alphaproteobacteria bacterium]